MISLETVDSHDVLQTSLSWIMNQCASGPAGMSGCLITTSSIIRCSSCDSSMARESNAKILNGISVLAVDSVEDILDCVARIGCLRPSRAVLAGLCSLTSPEADDSRIELAFALFSEITNRLYVIESTTSPPRRWLHSYLSSIME